MIQSYSQIESYEIINIIRYALSCIDSRLISHGERVDFVSKMILKKLNTDIEESKLLVLSTLHDVGAYKTEEIDNMVEFESQDVWRHAIYGYLFLKNTAAISESAEAILYHHMPWSKLINIDTKWKYYAALIYLADRIDILTLGHNRENAYKNLETLKTDNGNHFYPEFVNAFFEADNELRIVDRLLDGSYIEAVVEGIQSASFSSSETMQYLEMLVDAIDFRSPYTVTHSTNTMSLSIEIAKYFDLSESEMEDIKLGSFLHDIGKIAVPYAILESPNRLSDDEMSKMRTHVEKTDEIIHGFVKPSIRNIAVRHHEKMDGSGYPKGLTAADLTLSERIVAVADILSALISRRSYKEPFPREKALEIIMKMCSDGQLAPEVCGVLVEHYDDIVRATNERSLEVIKKYDSIMKEYGELREKVREMK